MSKKLSEKQKCEIKEKALKNINEAVDEIIQSDITIKKARADVSKIVKELDDAFKMLKNMVITEICSKYDVDEKFMRKIAGLAKEKVINKTEEDE